MRVKSLSELKELQKKNQPRIDLREAGRSQVGVTEILVGMATCGIASGAKETFDALNEMIKSEGLDNINVVRVGCLGYCVNEPTLQVCRPGQEPVLYGKITKDKAKQFFDVVILKGENLEEGRLIASYEKAGCAHE